MQQPDVLLKPKKDAPILDLFLVFVLFLLCYYNLTWMIKWKKLSQKEFVSDVWGMTISF